MFLVGQHVTVNNTSDLASFYNDEIGTIGYMDQEFDDPFVYKIQFSEMPTAWLFESELTLVKPVGYSPSS